MPFVCQVCKRLFPPGYKAGFGEDREGVGDTRRDTATTIILGSVSLGPIMGIVGIVRIVRIGGGGGCSRQVCPKSS